MADTSGPAKQQAAAPQKIKKARFLVGDFRPSTWRGARLFAVVVGFIRTRHVTSLARNHRVLGASQCAIAVGIRIPWLVFGRRSALL